jgi:demethylmenaquinone methyltransferase/2-methoxy-6-polyprenyl-1,4-benzoquinol methylase
MLIRGRGKSARAVPCNGDALALPFGDAGFDGATVGFGVRNLMDLNAGLAEAARVLKPGARLVILEFSMPSRRWLRTLYSRYFLRILPVVGRFVSKHRDAYTWLPESVLAFPEPVELAIRMRTTGFSDVSFQTMLGGICAIHVGTRSSE